VHLKNQSKFYMLTNVDYFLKKIKLINSITKKQIKQFIIERTSKVIKSIKKTKD
jgi:hypothetical protein